MSFMSKAGMAVAVLLLIGTIDYNLTSIDTQQKIAKVPTRAPKFESVYNTNIVWDNYGAPNSRYNRGEWVTNIVCMEVRKVKNSDGSDFMEPLTPEQIARYRASITDMSNTGVAHRSSRANSMGWLMLGFMMGGLYMLFGNKGMATMWITAGFVMTFIQLVFNWPHW